MIAGVVSYMLLCWGGGGFRGFDYGEDVRLIEYAKTTPSPT